MNTSGSPPEFDTGKPIMSSEMEEEPSNYSTPSVDYTAANVLGTVGTTLGAVSIVLNIIFIIGLHFQQEKTSAYNRLMKYLAIADVMAAVSFLIIQNWPHGFFAHIGDQNAFILVQVLPYVFRSFPWMFFTTYMLTLSCLTINQYVAVCRPWRYSELVTNPRITLLLVIVWCLSSLQILIPLTVILVLYFSHTQTAAMKALYTISAIEIQVWMAIFIFSNIVNILVNMRIYRKIHQLKLKRRRSHTMKSAESTNIRTKQEAFVTVALLLVASLFCRLPFPLTGLISINLDSPTLNASIVFLLYLNFFVDPIIYLTRMREVKRFYSRQFAVCLRCLPRRNRPSVDIERSTLQSSMRLVSAPTDIVALEPQESKAESVPLQPTLV